MTPWLTWSLLSRADTPTLLDRAGEAAQRILLQKYKSKLLIKKERQKCVQLISKLTVICHVDRDNDLHNFYLVLSTLG